MKIYGLVGPSGTGKSHIAEQVAKETNSTYIIDDGVLVAKGHIIAGYSGKLEKHAIKAVRRAVFMDKEHRNEVRTALSHCPPDTHLLILGTSQKMITTICSNLGLSDGPIWLHIEDLVSEEELSLASRLRTYGMHAMPIIASEVQKSKHYRLLKRIQYRIHRRSDLGSFQQKKRLIVNPVFSKGGIYVHPRAIRELISCVIAEEQHPFELRQTKIEFDPSIIVRIYAAIQSGYNIQQASEALLAGVHSSLTENLGLPLIQVFIKVESIIV